MAEVEKETSDLEEIDATEESEEDAIKLPPFLMKRLTGLKKLHEDVEAIDAQYKAERVLLEKKYHEQRMTVYEKRRQAVAGEEEVESPSDSEPAEEGSVKGMPGFWLGAISNHPMLSTYITEPDLVLLGHLVDISVTYNEDYTKFTLKFVFSENEHFTNAFLEKSYTLSPDLLDEKAPSLVESSSTDIEWKQGKSLLVKEVKKKQKAKSGRNKGQVRTVTREEPTASFFHYFTEPKEDEEEEEEDEEKEDFKLGEEEDFEIAHTFRTTILPNAVNWFTGEAEDLDYEGMYEDDEDEDEDEDEDDDDDDDDDEDSEPEEKPKGRKGKGSPSKGKNRGGFAGPNQGGAGQGENPECKQN